MQKDLTNLKKIGPKPDSLSPLTGVANISQVVGQDTGEQSPEEGRGIIKKSCKKVLGMEKSYYRNKDKLGNLNLHHRMS